MANNYKEYLLTTDEFKNPKVLTGSIATGILITRLLLLNPGTNPLHPDMGVGIGPKYRFITESEMSNLQDRIESQMNIYLPTDLITDIKINLDIKESKYLSIRITVNEDAYIYDTEDSDTPIQVSLLN
jgi:hypothetical protein